MTEAGPIALCLAGAISPEVALARLLLAGRSPEQIAAELEAQDAAPAARLRSLVGSRGEALRDVGAVLGRASHDGGDVHAVRRMFDRAVAEAPEASVAAYSLNDPTILAAATGELMAWLEAEGLLRPAMDVLDLGCGIGRVAAAIAPHVRSVLGVDVSAGMVAEARRRCAAANLRFEQTDGHDLSRLAGLAFELVIAVDSFPYLVQAGVAEAHVRDIARLLRPGGVLAILNLSYRADEISDVDDLQRWCREFGLVERIVGAKPFKLWDGRAFVVERR